MPEGGGRREEEGSLQSTPNFVSNAQEIGIAFALLPKRNLSFLFKAILPFPVLPFQTLPASECSGSCCSQQALLEGRHLLLRHLSPGNGSEVASFSSVKHLFRAAGGLTAMIWQGRHLGWRMESKGENLTLCTVRLGLYIALLRFPSTS